MEEYWFDTLEDWEFLDEDDDEEFVDPYGTAEADAWWAAQEYWCS